MLLAVAVAQEALLSMFWFFFGFNFLMEKNPNKQNFRLGSIYAESLAGTLWGDREGQSQMADLPGCPIGQEGAWTYTHMRKSTPLKTQKQKQASTKQREKNKLGI